MQPVKKGEITLSPGNPGGSHLMLNLGKSDSLSKACGFTILACWILFGIQGIQFAEATQPEARQGKPPAWKPLNPSLFSN
jgi:hypothetical protein